MVDSTVLLAATVTSAAVSVAFATSWPLADRLWLIEHLKQARASLIERARILERSVRERRQRATPVTTLSEASGMIDVVNLGLSADIMATDETSYVTANFEATEEYAWLKQHAAEYGFILRYPSGKEDVTGFAYEPWHYRYVGVDQAARINASGLTLEEYLAQDAPTGDPTSVTVQTDVSGSDSVAQ